MRAFFLLFFLVPLSALGEPCGGPDEPPCDCRDVRATAAERAMCDDTMFDRDYTPIVETTSVGPQRTETEVIRQVDAFNITMRIADSCIRTSLYGRSDTDCSSNRDHPDCAGVFHAIENATHCEEWHEPRSRGCKTLGPVNGISNEQWASIANDYITQGVTPCLNHLPTVQKTENREDVVADMLSLTDMVEGTEGIAGTAAPSRAQSGISGSTGPENLRDGSEFIGYENGEILRRIKAGDAFLDVLTESPFYSKLTPVKRTSFITALENSQEVVAKVREKIGPVAGKDSTAREGNERGLASTHKSTSDSDPRGPGAYVGPKDGETAGGKAENGVAQAGAASSGYAANTNLEMASVTLTTIPANAFFDVNENAKLVEQQRAAALAAEQAARNAKVLEEFSLFERVRKTYQKRAPSLKRLELSETARAVSTTEMPQFFNSL